MAVCVYFVLAMESFITKGFHVSFLVISGWREKCKGKGKKQEELPRDMQSDFPPRLRLR